MSANASPGQSSRWLDQVRDTLRTKHYSIRTESVYADWIGTLSFFMAPGCSGMLQRCLSHALAPAPARGFRHGLHRGL